MSLQPNDLYRSPNALARHYTRFRVAERLLLTGHSHQAWPDRAERGQQRAFEDAARLVDAKWERAQLRADRVRSGFARLLDDTPEGISLGANTHELVVKFLSALPLRERPRLLTTDSEFHSLRRQLARLEEEGIEVVRVASRPAQSLGERLAQKVDDQTAAALTSSVFYDSAEIAGELHVLAQRCAHHGAELLVDVYHQLNVVPFSLRAAGLENAYVVGGGYKYCQLGEGNAFLRAPPACSLRPVITGWFADFEALAGEPSAPVTYGPLSMRFAGATYDPTSHYRAAEVFSFFDEFGIEPGLLRQVSQHQVGLLATEFDALGLAPGFISRREVPLDRIAGFLALDCARAGDLQRELLRRGVHSDARGAVVRLGPAPYSSDAQLRDAMGILGEAARHLGG
jgi:kynureninase